MGFTIPTGAYNMSKKLIKWKGDLENIHNTSNNYVSLV